MTKLDIPESLMIEVESHALACYPEECCGVLIGSRCGGSARSDFRVEEVVAAANVDPGPRSRRYSIDPRHLLEAYQLARQGGTEVVGYYHSHPDRSADPSTTDLAAAAADVCFLIVAVDGDRGRFEEVPLV